MDSTNPIQPSKHGSIAVIGAGNIGSHLLELVARMPAVGHVTIVDFDAYEEKNLGSQAIAPGDVSRPKAEVQASRLKEIAPRLSTVALVERLENAPMGALRADVLISCLDSKAGRRTANRMAWRLGVPFIDAGLQADGMLARMSVFRPGFDQVCYECTWEAHDYAQERESFACDGTPVEAPATNASGSLGALAAALVANEAEKILAGDWERVATGREIVIETGFHHHYVTRLVRNPACRFDHRTFAVQRFHGEPERLTLADVFGLGLTGLHMDGRQFARRWACASCLAQREVFGLRDRVGPSVECPECGRQMQALGFDLIGRLTPADVSPELLSEPLSRFGFRRNDIFSGEVDGVEVHFEIVSPEDKQ